MTSRANRILVLATGALALACSSGGASSGNAAQFVGTWTYDSGSSATPMMCSVLGQVIPSTPVDLTGNTVAITMGADSFHIQFVDGTSCTITFTVSGMTATAAAGQMCTFTFDNFPVVVNVSSWSLTLSGDSLTAAFSGSAALGGPSCTASGSATLTRNATDGSTAG